MRVLETFFWLPRFPVHGQKAAWAALTHGGRPARVPPALPGVTADLWLCSSPWSEDRAERRGGIWEPYLTESSTAPGCSPHTQGFGEFTPLASWLPQHSSPCLSWTFYFPLICRIFCFPALRADHSEAHRRGVPTSQVSSVAGTWRRLACVSFCFRHVPSRLSGGTSLAVQITF